MPRPDENKRATGGLRNLKTLLLGPAPEIAPIRFQALLKAQAARTHTFELPPDLDALLHNLHHSIKTRAAQAGVKTD